MHRIRKFNHGVALNAMIYYAWYQKIQSQRNFKSNASDYLDNYMHYFHIPTLKCDHFPYVHGCDHLWIWRNKGAHVEDFVRSPFPSQIITQ